jgi:NAD(P)-dependent dehydrogenase (short-subunit alcohol dehydrogenase family)/pimeloyl-ACP methyl ester carboxylesterase
MAATMRVVCTDGVALAVYEHGDPSRPTVVAVHGYPDDHRVWDGVVAILAERYRVITYDVRGTGESDQPTNRRDYLMAQLVADLGAVLDAVSPERPVHLLAHDWGAIHSWAAVCDARFADRLASFTSISGPSLDHSGAWLRQARKHPRAATRQLLGSAYIALFQIPGLPEALMRSRGNKRLEAAIGRIGRSSRASGDVPPRTEANKINGLQLYRANMLRHVGRPRPQHTNLPVLVLAPARDPFVTPALQTQAPRPYATNLRTRTIAGGHWVVSHRPDVIARLTTEFIELVEGGTAAGPAEAHQRRTGTFAGKFVVVTGGGGGIGRATAIEFARQGADLVIADIDDTAAKETVTLVQALGVEAAEYHLDVSGAEAWERFAEQVHAEHGVADVIVNNAGIGMGGPFLHTSTADWEKIIGVNLWGVIHGSRLFAEQMVQRGEGGHIVNIASAAAYSPSRIYPAYATTKAAVLMLSECLRAELSREHIGVTAICPGFIDTDISRTTVHVGVDDATQQSLREHAVASYGRRNYTPERVARHVVRAAARNKPIAAITVESKLLRAITRFAPPLARQIAKVDLNKL